MTLEVLDKQGNLLGWLPVPTICDWNWPRPMRPPRYLRYTVGRPLPIVRLPYLAPQPCLNRIVDLPIGEFCNDGAQPRVVLYAHSVPLDDLIHIEGFRRFHHGLWAWGAI